MSKKNFAQFCRALAGGEVAPVYLFSGGEPYLEQEALRRLVQTLEPASRDFNYRVLDGRETSAEEVLALARTLPGLGPRRLVVVREPLALSGRKGDKSRREEEAYLAYLESPPATTCLVLVAGAVDGRSRLVRALAARGEHVELKPLRGPELTAWVRERMRERGQRLSPDGLAYLLATVENDPLTLEGEIEKLALYAAGRADLTREDVAQVLAGHPAATVFQLVDAVGEKKTAAALRCLESLRWAGEPPVRLNFMLARQVRLILAAKLLRTAGLEPASLPARLEVPDFVARRLLDQARHYTVSELVGALEVCLEVDHLLKSGATKPYLVLEQAVLRLCHQASGRPAGRNYS